MSNRGVAITLAAVFALAFPAASPSASGSQLRGDLDHYFAELERIHPDPYHSTSAAPTGGAPNHSSDTSPVTLEATGLTVQIPRIWYEKHPGLPGVTVEPDVPVQMTAADFFAGRDPVLRKAQTTRVEPKSAAATFQDPQGDAGTAPDITSVTVSGDRTGEMSFSMPLDGFDGEAQLFVAIDIDGSSATGDRNGIEVVLDARPGGSVRIRRWNGSELVPFTEAATSFSYTAGVATFRIDAPYLGLYPFIGFGVVSVRGSSTDAAPNSGSYRYRAAPPLLVRFVPPRPVAGRRFTLRAPGAAYVSCSAVLGGKALPRGCVWKLPRSARGKALVVRVVVDGESRTFRFRVR